MPKKKFSFVILDSHAIIHRAFHALPPLTTKDGRPIQAVYGFTMILIKVLKDFRPDYIVATFDAAGPTFRHESYQAYKATRVKQPDELYMQIPWVKEIVQAFGIPLFEQRGVEADDLIGTLKTRVIERTPDIDVDIVTGDMDTLQLVDHRTIVHAMKQGVKDIQKYGISEVKARYGLKPEQMIDFKALRGDPSDNIPGVRGIGEKTATKLLTDYRTLEGIYEHVDGISGKLGEKLKEHKQDAFMSKDLATIRCDVKVPFVLADAEWRGVERDTIVPVFQKFEFKSLLAQLLPLTSRHPETTVSHQSLGQGEEKKEHIFSVKQEYIFIDSEEKFAKFYKDLRTQKLFAFDTETHSLDSLATPLLGMSFAWRAGKAYYVLGSFLSRLKDIFENKNISKVGHNIKFDAQVLETQGVLLRGIFFDTMVASYVLNPGSRAHGLDRVVFTEFGYEMQPIEDLIGKGKKQISMAEVEQTKVAWYAAEDADFTWRLYEALEPELKKKQVERVFYDIDMPLIPVLQRMERFGVKVDIVFLKKMSVKFGKHIQDLEKRIYDLAGKEFNIASPLQLKEILFERLKLSTQNIGKTKTGFSTGAEELEKLRGAHPIIPLISQYREYTKLKSTYIDALPKLAHAKTGRVHTSFNQTIAATGRLSSSDPNLQNIPIRTELGREIRKGFIAEKGYTLVSADYSQIELRIVASLARDKAMLATFRKGEDIHTATAAALAGVPLEKVTKDMRRAAKSVNFGILYGMGPYGIARDAGISREEASEFLQKYFDVYHGVRDYLDHVLEDGRKKGYTETLFGRRRYLPELLSSMRQVRQAAERMAVNMPVQGTEADLVKMAMLDVDSWLREKFRGDEVRMLLQVHDELVFEVRDELLKKFCKELKPKMEKVYTLECPIVVDVHVGHEWGDMETL